MWRKIKKVIQDNDSFLITTHINPDGDGVGSACALIELLLQMGKTVSFICDSPIPRKFSFLDFHSFHHMFDPEQSYDDIDVVFVLDAHKKDRIGRIFDIIQLPHVIGVCVDHHEADSFFTRHTVIDLYSCSVGAMIYTLYKECGYDLTLEAAMGIYTSIVCDTGRFSYSTTSRKAHKIADECIKLGVDPQIMYSQLFQRVPLAEVKMFATALQRMETHWNDTVIIQEIRLEDYDINMCDSNQDFEYIHEFNKLIEDVECVIVLRELSQDIVRVSARSKSAIGIEVIMKNIGGGGHKKAAGALWSGTISEVKAYLLSELSKVFDLALVYNH